MTARDAENLLTAFFNGGVRSYKTLKKMYLWSVSDSSFTQLELARIKRRDRRKYEGESLLELYTDISDVVALN